METTDKLIERTKQRVKEEKLKEGSQVREALKKEMISILEFPSMNRQSPHLRRSPWLLEWTVPERLPLLAKLAFQAKSEGKSVLLAAGDTFEQQLSIRLRTWAERIGVEIVAHQPGADPGAVVYDAMVAAKSRQAQELIIDTAGRLHTKFNLMEELKKNQTCYSQNRYYCTADR